MEIVFFIVGLLFAAIGSYVLWDAHRFARQAVRGEGLVIGFAVNERRGKPGSRTTYNPVIRYRHEGEDYQFTGRLGSSHVKRRIGDPAAILISPDDPGDARLDELARTGRDVFVGRCVDRGRRPGSSQPRETAAAAVRGGGAGVLMQRTEASGRPQPAWQPTREPHSVQAEQQ